MITASVNIQLQHLRVQRIYDDTEDSKEHKFSLFYIY